MDASRPPRRPPEFRAILGMTSALPVLGPLPRLRGPAQAHRAGQSGFSAGFLVRLDWINVPRVAPGRYPRRPPSSGDPLLEPNGTGPAHPGRMTRDYTRCGAGRIRAGKLFRKRLTAHGIFFRRGAELVALSAACATNFGGGEICRMGCARRYPPTLRMMGIAALNSPHGCRLRSGRGFRCENFSRETKFYRRMKVPTVSN